MWHFEVGQTLVPCSYHENVKELQFTPGIIFQGCRVFLFYFSGARDFEPKLKEKLKGFGDIAGQNLCMSIWDMADTELPKLVNEYKLKALPAIVITGIPEVASASTGKDNVTVFVRIDNENVLRDSEATLDMVEKIFDLFLRGEMKEALKEASKDQKLKMLEHYVGGLGKVLGNFLATHSISVDFLKGTVTVSPADKNSKKAQ